MYSVVALPTVTGPQVWLTTVAGQRVLCKLVHTIPETTACSQPSRPRSVTLSSYCH